MAMNLIWTLQDPVDTAHWFLTGDDLHLGKRDTLPCFRWVEASEAKHLTVSWTANI
jgi:hypothetical protein